MNIILTKQSEEAEIRTYFEGVMRLADSNEQFPVNLDEVWPVVYDRKDEAVRVLKSDFLQDVDYQVFHKKAENPSGGRPVDNYFLSVSCLEYFIARKVRPVFEVYRQVFHKVAQLRPLSPAEFLLHQAQLMVDQERRVSRLEDKVQEIDARTQTRPDYATVVGYCTQHGYSIGLREASYAGQQASRICKSRNIVTESIPDPRFGYVKMYPRGVLDEVFSKRIT